MSIVDNVDMENQIGEVVDAFEEKMKILFEEVPEMFEGRSTEQEWSCQVTNCGLDLVAAIDKLVEKCASLEIRACTIHGIDELTRGPGAQARTKLVQTGSKLVQKWSRGGP